MRVLDQVVSAKLFAQVLLCFLPIKKLFFVSLQISRRTHFFSGFKTSFVLNNRFQNLFRLVLRRETDLEGGVQLEIPGH